jgi:hypothetical protein
MNVRINFDSLEFINKNLYQAMKIRFITLLFIIKDFKNIIIKNERCCIFNKAVKL